MNGPKNSSRNGANPAPHAAYPLTFSTSGSSLAATAYLADPVIRKLADFCERKGLTALKEEDRAERWYADWLAYQAEHGLYASILSPRRYALDGAGGGAATGGAGV